MKRKYTEAKTAGFWSSPPADGPAEIPCLEYPRTRLFEMHTIPREKDKPQHHRYSCSNLPSAKREKTAREVGRFVEVCIDGTAPEAPRVSLLANMSMCCIVLKHDLYQTGDSSECCLLLRQGSLSCKGGEFMADERPNSQSYARGLATKSLTAANRITAVTRRC